MKRSGSMSIQFLILMVPVMFGLMGFAVDLGRLYLVRGELNQAANAMALAAAARLIGTEVSSGDATLSAHLTLDNSTGRANKYNFGSIVIGEGGGTLASEVPEPSLYATASEAAATSDSGASTAAATEAKSVRISLTAEAPLTFWGLLSLGQSRKATIAGQAAAGQSAPLCTACGVDPLVIAALDPDDTTDFGYVAATLYTLGYQCNGAPQPGLLAGTAQRVPYLLIDRYDSNSLVSEDQQLYRIGAQGLLPSTAAATSCITINSADGEQIWGAVNGGSLTSAPLACNQNRVQSAVTNALCGMYTRLDQNLTPPGACGGVTDVEALAATYAADSDVTNLEDYIQYTGNTRRVITVAVVDALNAGGAMTVLGFRQFLLQPAPNDVVTNPADANGRFIALYIGSKVPIRQGSFAGGCGAVSGPGKVVLLQ